MFALPGIAGLLVFIYLRPHEVYSWAAMVSFPLMLGLAIVGVVLDWRVAATRPRLSLMLGLAIAFFTWASFTSFKVPDTAKVQIGVLASSFLLWAVFAHGAQSLRAFQFLAEMVLGVTVLLAVVGVHQGVSPRVCIERNEASDGGEGPVVTDGRRCSHYNDCEADPNSAVEYKCERTGMFGTATIGGRIRFRGVLQDPNELAWAISLGLPFAFIFQRGQRSRRRMVLLVGIVALAVACVVLTRSRSGQLSLLTVLGAFFVRRFGWRGVVAGAVVALPLLIYGGRSGAEAESSSMERLDCWEAGIEMFRNNPVLGVGAGEFANNHYLTAHNSYILTLAELGPLGLFLFSCALYLSGKMLLRAIQDFQGTPQSAIVSRWATALLVSLLGTLVSSFFLSIAYHPVLWIQLGLIWALYGAIRRHAPHWRVKFGWRDLFLIGVADIGIITAIYGYVRLMWKLGG